MVSPAYYAISFCETRASSAGFRHPGRHAFGIALLPADTGTRSGTRITKIVIQEKLDDSMKI